MHATNIKMLKKTLKKLLLFKNSKVIPLVQNIYSKYARNEIK
jgi:hypothetical protein